MLSRIKSFFERPKVAPAEAEPAETVASTGPSVAPAVVIACGAGVAFWWWSQWARSREEARTTPSTPPQSKPDEITEIVGAGAASELDQSLAVQADAETPPLPSTPSALPAEPTLAA